MSPSEDEIKREKAPAGFFNMYKSHYYNANNKLDSKESGSAPLPSDIKDKPTNIAKPR